MRIGADFEVGDFVAGISRNNTSTITDTERALDIYAMGFVLSVEHLDRQVKRLLSQSESRSSTSDKPVPVRHLTEAEEGT